MNFEFKEGQKVVKIFYGIAGYRKAYLAKVTSVKNNIVKIDENEGVTYSAITGKELENFFPPMRSEITPL